MILNKSTNSIALLTVILETSRLDDIGGVAYFVPDDPVWPWAAADIRITSKVLEKEKRNK